jgi:hypothetical protein
MASKLMTKLIIHWVCFLTTHHTSQLLTWHAPWLDSPSIMDDVHDGGELPASCEIWQPNEVQSSGVWCHVVWQKGISVQETLSATIRVEDEGSSLVPNDTSLPHYMVLHSARCIFLPESNFTGLPEEDVQRPQLQSDSSSLGMASCHCCL